MPSPRPYMSLDNILVLWDPSTPTQNEEVTYEKFGVLRRYNHSKFADVVLHFHGIHMLIDERVLTTSCPFFYSVFHHCPRGKKPREYTIENYSKDAVMTMLYHIYSDGDALDQSTSYQFISEEEMPDMMKKTCFYIEVFEMTNEYDVPTLRSQAQANIMAIRKRAIELKDSFFAGMICSDVLNMYRKDWMMDLHMMDELASQCLGYECVMEEDHFWMYRKVDGVWVAKNEEYEKLVRRLNAIDTGMIPIPMWAW
jgi:hypothetical protein